MEVLEIDPFQKQIYATCLKESAKRYICTVIKKKKKSELRCQQCYSSFSDSFARANTKVYDVYGKHPIAITPQTL